MRFQFKLNNINNHLASHAHIVIYEMERRKKKTNTVRHKPALGQPACITHNNRAHTIDK